MSGKIFPSRGVSSRPLTFFERLTGQVHLSLQRYHPNLVEISLLAVIIAKLKHAWRKWRNRNNKPSENTALQSLVKALEAGSYTPRSTELQRGQPLKVESLEATMATVTFKADRDCNGETCSDPFCRCGCHL